MSYRVLIFGSRDWTDQFPIWCVLNGYWADQVGITVVNGRGRGADRIAWEWAGLNGVDREPYPADWNRYGRAAGSRRNQQMADSKPDVAWGFVTKPLAESAGSADMAGRLEVARIPFYIVRGRGTP